MDNLWKIHLNPDLAISVGSYPVAIYLFLGWEKTGARSEAREDSWEGTKEKFFFVPSFSAHLRPRLPYVTVSARAQSYIRKIVNWEQSINKLEDEHTMLLISVPCCLQKTAYRTQYRVKNIN